MKSRKYDTCAIVLISIYIVTNSNIKYRKTSSYVRTYFLLLLRNDREHEAHVTFILLLRSLCSSVNNKYVMHSQHIVQYKATEKKRRKRMVQRYNCIESHTTVDRSQAIDKFIRGEDKMIKYQRD